MPAWKNRFNSAPGEASCLNGGSRLLSEFQVSSLMAHYSRLRIAQIYCYQRSSSDHCLRYAEDIPVVVQYACGFARWFLMVYRSSCFTGAVCPARRSSDDMPEIGCFQFARDGQFGMKIRKWVPQSAIIFVPGILECSLTTRRSSVSARSSRYRDCRLNTD